MKSGGLHYDVCPTVEAVAVDYRPAKFKYAHVHACMLLVWRFVLDGGCPHGDPRLSEKRRYGRCWWCCRLFLCSLPATFFGIVQKIHTHTRFSNTAVILCFSLAFSMFEELPVINPDVPKFEYSHHRTFCTLFFRSVAGARLLHFLLCL